MKKIMIIFVFALTVVFSNFIFTQMREYNNYLREEQMIAAELEKEREILNKLIREKEQGLTDAYVEKIAREKLGLVRHDEIVFINEAAR